MRAGIGLAVLVAIGLIWSVAVMFDWVPVQSEELRSATTSPHSATVSQAEISPVSHR
jgi:hypothetical protein